MIPDNIKREHIIQALEEIDRTGIPNSKASVLYDLRYNGKLYPPRHVIRIANVFANGEELERVRGTETFDFLRTNGFEIVPKKEEVGDLAAALRQRFSNIWRCADSNLWLQIKESNLLTLEWLDPERDYRNKPIQASESGKNSIRPWVNDLGENDLIFIMDKNSFYGIALSNGIYDFDGPKLGGKPAIPVEFVYKLPGTREPHGLTVHNQPSTFAKIDQYNFGLEKVLTYLKTRQPDGFHALQNLIESSNHLPVKQPFPSNPHALNTILYGPPGTGKTYHTINIALEILGERLEGLTRKEIKDLFEQRMREGRIAFVTFHQSMSYEDFIEGIKPQQPNKEGEGIVYRVEPGIFRKMAEKADKRAGNFLEIVEKFKQEISEVDGKPPIVIKSPSSTFDVIYRSGTMFYIQPHNRAKESAWYPVSIDNIKKFHDTESLEGTYNTTYVRGIHQFLVKERGLKKGWDSNESIEPHVLIIDEINRGNISQIFGELITLIEDDKRLGSKEALEAILPYSKASFGVPPNLYLIGTMNTADRSVEALDTALRRRFTFVEMPPKPALISPKQMILRLWNNPQHKQYNWDDEAYVSAAQPLYDFLGVDKATAEKPYMVTNSRSDKNDTGPIPDYDLDDLAHLDKITTTGINLERMLEKINQRIEKLIDKDHRIGHAYFMGLETSGDPLAQLRIIFQNKILPLLQEYFYGNYGKMQLVLGKDFVYKPNTSAPDFFFAVNDYQGHDDAFEREVYHVVNWMQTERNEFGNDFLTAVRNIYTAPKNG